MAHDQDIPLAILEPGSFRAPRARRSQSVKLGEPRTSPAVMNPRNQKQAEEVFRLLPASHPRGHTLIVANRRCCHDGAIGQAMPHKNLAASRLQRAQIKRRRVVDLSCPHQNRGITIEVEFQSWSVALRRPAWKEGLVTDPLSCKWQPEMIACAQGSSSPDCLNSKQVAAVKRLMMPATNSKAEVLWAYPLIPGTEMQWVGWNFFGAPESGLRPRLGNLYLPGQFLKYLADEKVRTNRAPMTVAETLRKPSRRDYRPSGDIVNGRTGQQSIEVFREPLRFYQNGLSTFRTPFHVGVLDRFSVVLRRDGLSNERDNVIAAPGKILLQVRGQKPSNPMPLLSCPPFPVTDA